MVKRFDVTIVGAGLAGLQCARLLAAEGVSVLLVDRKDDVRNAVRTTGIFVRKSFEEFNFPAESLGPVVRRVVLHSPKGRMQTLESNAPEFRIGRMQKIYGDLLKEAIADGTTWKPSTSFFGIDRDANGETIVWLRGARGLEKVTTRFIVGADGARSKVAAALGLSRNKELIVGVEEVLQGVAGTRTAALHCFLDPGLAPGYIGWLADDGQEIHLGVGGYADSFDPRAALKELRRRAADICDLESGQIVERRGGLIPVGGMLPRIACERGLLIGDSAGAVSPLTAGGLDGAMRLSRFAAEVLAVAVKRRSPSLVSLYTSRGIGTRFISRQWMRKTIATVRSPMLIELGCALLRTQPFSGFAQHVFFGRGSFPEPDRRALQELRSVES
ncbi:MAG TPA: NAD(P)/FAD-dependent oxidoreductase [Thermoanaerobaculia bacterium]|nr:NAD(P)/FAD-dependent oxidoreductase [Thermoanaerobaculia bacterium]